MQIPDGVTKENGIRLGGTQEKGTTEASFQTRGEWYKWKYKKYHFNIKSKQTEKITLTFFIGRVITQTGCGVSTLGDTQNRTVHGPEQLALAGPALSRGQHRQFPQAPFNLSCSVILLADPDALQSSLSTLTCIIPQIS